MTQSRLYTHVPCHAESTNLVESKVGTSQNFGRFVRLVPERQREKDTDKRPGQWV